MSHMDFPETIITAEGETLQFWSKAPVPVRQARAQFCYVNGEFGYFPFHEPGKLYYEKWPARTRYAAWYVRDGHMFIAGFDKDGLRIVLPEASLEGEGR